MGCGTQDDDATLPTLLNWLLTAALVGGAMMVTLLLPDESSTLFSLTGAHHLRASVTSVGRSGCDLCLVVQARLVYVSSVTCCLSSPNGGNEE